MTWSVVSGSATLETSTGRSATLLMPATTTDSSVVVKASAKDDSSKSTTITIPVIAATLSLPASAFDGSSEQWDKVVKAGGNQAGTLKSGRV